MKMLMTLHGVIVAIVVSITSIVTIVVPVLMLTLNERSRIVTHYDLILRINHGCQPFAIERVVWLYHYKLSKFTL